MYLYLNEEDKNSACTRGKVLRCRQIVLACTREKVLRCRPTQKHSCSELLYCRWPIHYATQLKAVIWSCVLVRRVHVEHEEQILRLISRYPILTVPCRHYSVFTVGQASWYPGGEAGSSTTCVPDGEKWKSHRSDVIAVEIFPQER